MTQFTITPKVDQAREFVEIANDFSNPLDIVREAISNAYDAKATRIEVCCRVNKEHGEEVFTIELVDNGHGMGRPELQAFFDLGNSTRRGDESSIGEKGHGTKVYLNSSNIRVRTTRGGITLDAEMAWPKGILSDGEIPTVMVVESKGPQKSSGTAITIKGYNNNRRDRFSHERMRDHILWFTKHGSVEKVFSYDQHRNVKLLLQGVDRTEPEIIPFGHPFPEVSEGDIEKLRAKWGRKAPDNYCKRIIKSGNLPNFPEVKYDLVFSLEGNWVKYSYNPMISRQRYSAPEGAYRIQDRYGLWLCKDFIPVQRRNEWVVDRGFEFTRFKAFFNCQAFSLTANRGSVENTPSEKMKDVEKVIRDAYNNVTATEDWRSWDELEESSQGIRVFEREQADLKARRKRANSANVATHKGHILVQPERESGVYALVVQLELLEPALFPFKIVDYDTYSGIDAIVKSDRKTPVDKSELLYVEFKHTLTDEFNHSFDNTHSIICWDTAVKHGGIIKDIRPHERKLSISAPQGKRKHTRYYLAKSGSPQTIEVYVLRDYLKERLGVEFRPRTKTDVF